VLLKSDTGGMLDELGRWLESQDDRLWVVLIA
jgi:hypothetical protein